MLRYFSINVFHFKEKVLKNVINIVKLDIIIISLKRCSRTIITLSKNHDIYVGIFCPIHI